MSLSCALEGESGYAIEALHAGYGDLPVLEGIDLSLPVGQVTAIVGPGGSGKTTLVRLISREPAPGLWSTGALLPAGSAPVVLHQLLATEVEPLSSPLDPMRIRELERLARVVWKNQPDAANELVEQLGAPRSTWQRWQHQLIRFTETCGQLATIYVFDEPDTDAPSRILPWLAAKLRELARGSVVLLVTHNLLFTRLAADRVAVLVEGRLVESGRTEQIFTRPGHPRAQRYLRMGS
ncbi:MAG: ATP-binding cassette domain-containing protein [Acidobacteria bacterium]|nr:ATP-binding cassette domain-containing protein [Acidobacteriota bacterium]